MTTLNMTRNEIRTKSAWITISLKFDQRTFPRMRKPALKAVQQMPRDTFSTRRRVYWLGNIFERMYAMDERPPVTAAEAG